MEVIIQAILEVIKAAFKFGEAIVKGNNENERHSDEEHTDRTTSANVERSKITSNFSLTTGAALIACIILIMYFIKQN